MTGSARGTEPPVITAWSVISPIGEGGAAFADGLAGPPADRPRNPVADFDIEQRLGTKGTGSMDRCTALAIEAVGQLLALGPTTDAATGVVLGTTSGSAQTQFAFTRESLIRRKPYFVNPALMPFALMNSAAGRCAIWHRLTGPNSTIAAGRLSGPSVLRYATRLLATGRASGVVCGAVEELTEARALLDRHQPGGGIGLGEGAATVFLEPAGTSRPALARLLAVGTRLARPGAGHRELSDCVRHVLGVNRLAPDDVRALAVSATDPGSAAVESKALDEVFGRHRPDAVCPARFTGDTGAVTGMFQLAALLSSAPAGRIGLATSVDTDGMVGCVLIEQLDGDR